MIRKAFIDSDVILDVATGRKPFVESSYKALAIIENGFALGVMSANSITNIYYVLRKLGSGNMAKDFLKILLNYMVVAPVDHATILKALSSNFSDFEDAVQNYCAVNQQCDFIITRNTADYQWSELTVLAPREFIALFG